MSINEKDMSFFFFYKRRASFYQGNLNFVTTNDVGGSEHLPGSPRPERSAAEVISQVVRALPWSFVISCCEYITRLRPLFRGLTPNVHPVLPKSPSSAKFSPSLGAS
jgi:hypothetical protein